MSVESEINRIKGNIADTYTVFAGKGATLPEVLNSDNLASTGATIPTGGGTVIVPEKDVNFYDYDGTVIASYTASEFANLSAMPDNPSHDGLTAQGWNWSLSDAKTYVSENGKLNIGQSYVTDDGKTRIYITLEEGRTDPYLAFATNGAVIVNWGDGNSNTVMGSSTDIVIYTQHIYSQPGDYVITLDLQPSQYTTSIHFYGSTQKGSYLITKNSTTINDNKPYNNSIKKIELGTNINLRNYAFYNCFSLKSINIPTQISSSFGGRNTFWYCYSLKYITIPNTVTSLPNYFVSFCVALKTLSLPKNISAISEYAFNSCYVLDNITLPANFTTLSDYIFYNCYSLKNIVITNKVKVLNTYSLSNCNSLVNVKIKGTLTNIYGNAFNSSSGVKKYDFTTPTAIPTLGGTSAFTGIASDCKIVVPDNLYENWIAASNWSTYASYIVKASQYSG